MYTIERFNEWLSIQGGQDEEPKNVKELLLCGAKHYYSNVRYMTNDYVTKAEIKNTIQKYFDQFYEQSLPQETIEDFANREGVETEAIHYAIEQRKEEFVEYLLKHVAEIASAANEELED